MQPEYIFETSWEVCNRVGGIYAVLSTRAASMQKEHKDKVVFLGPDLGAQSDVYFKESKTVLRGWRPEGVRVGRWQVPGKPIAVLLRWDTLWLQKDIIYRHFWERYGVQSHAACGDYDESCLFAYAVGQMVENLYRHLGMPIAVMHCNEWQTAFTILYIKEHCPQIGTLFTTHATGIGRSIAGNGKPLYDYFEGYHGDQMAQELNMVSKHSAEKTEAHECDCFTTVSDVTARECKQLLDKPVDIVTPNGFDQRFVPKGEAIEVSRKRARQALVAYAISRGAEGKVTDKLIGTSGRLEWKNKGIDVFLESIERLGRDERLQAMTKRKVLVFVMIPYLDKPDYTIGNVRVVFIPTYLNGNDGVLNMSYYELLVGLDLTIFPSYYEPWGYTPLESIAFHVPTITTSLSGFGMWCKGHGVETIDKGVAVVERTDSNRSDVVTTIVRILLYYFGLKSKDVAAIREAAWELSKQADWKHFYSYYHKAYAIALERSTRRTANPSKD